MNDFKLIGRLTRDPEVTYGKESNVAIGKFTLAINRYGSKEVTADFIPITCFGKVAENCEKHIRKGSLVAASGEIHSNTYVNKEGKKVYTYEFIANRIEFLSNSEKEKSSGAAEENDNENAALNENKTPPQEEVPIV